MIIISYFTHHFGIISFVSSVIELRKEVSVSPSKYFSITACMCQGNTDRKKMTHTSSAKEYCSSFQHSYNRIFSSQLPRALFEHVESLVDNCSLAIALRGTEEKVTHFIDAVFTLQQVHNFSVAPNSTYTHVCNLPSEAGCEEKEP